MGRVEIRIKANGEVTSLPQSLDTAYAYYEKQCQEQGIEVPFKFWRYWNQRVQGLKCHPDEKEWYESKKPKGYEWGDLPKKDK